MPNSADLNRTALITGAGRARGIGAATAMRLGRDGLSVAVADLVPPGDGAREVLDGLEAIARRIREAGGQAIVVPLDVTDPAQIDAAISATVDSFGGLDVLVNNAGTGLGVGPFSELSDDKWQLSWMVNVMGPMRLSRAALPHLSARGGAIVNVASTAGLGAEPGYGAYTVTKHAVVGLTRLLAVELGPSGVRVNAVAPGMIHTDMGAAELDIMAAAADSTVEDVTNTVLSGIPIRRLGTADDVAEAISWLAGPASYVSGAVVPVHGAAHAGLS
jgi:NAD(P)-dependent dehydrogenase (short-subunit alcohol dehydrogenase family)